MEAQQSYLEQAKTICKLLEKLDLKISNEEGNAFTSKIHTMSLGLFER